MKAEDLVSAIRRAIMAHDKLPKSPGKRYRGSARGTPRNTPSGIHPVWSGLTILHELALPEEKREKGAVALFFHDIGEDTTARPKIPKDIQELVKAMTFVNFDEEAELLWGKPPLVRLLKLYDKVSNWLDGDWMYPERRIIHRRHILKLAKDVERNFGTLNIVRIARAIVRVKIPQQA